MKITADDLIKTRFDSKRTTVKFKEDYQFDQIGDYEVEIIICRGNNRISKKTIVHVLAKDTTPPQILGIRNLTDFKR